MRKKRLLNRKKLIIKITQTDKNWRAITDLTQTIALTPKEDVATAHALRAAIVAEERDTLELFALKQHLTSLTRFMTHCSHAIL